MVTERLQREVGILARLPAGEQDRVTTAVERVLDQPQIGSDETRPDVVSAFARVMEHSTSVPDYLRDK